ncbi:hypothetical protein TWF696_007825 [Orbilia brochopaga]|uniref:Glycoside hydrolase family 17 protein n=1 Tax=Orbilia brochopaga TaxID=3140254 RepID=A0AAV9ULB2_9PEZI
MHFSVWCLAALSILSGANARPHHIHGDSLAPRDVALHRHVARDPKKKPGSSKQKSMSGEQGGWGPGIVYSPYANDGGCKDEATIRKEIAMIGEKGDGYKWCRIYGVDCNQVPVVVSAAAKANMKTFLGIYDLSDAGKVAESTKAIIEGVKGANKNLGKKDENDWSNIIGVSVGNEWIFNHPTDTPEKCKSLADSTRTTLRAAGYKGPVTNTDVWTIHRDKKFCGDEDVLTVNMHPFFDPNTDAAGGGTFMATHIKELEKTCPGKKVIVAETGWPNAGNTLNKAKPGKSEQQTFLQELKKNVKDYCVLSAFNEGWKQAGPSNVEKNWGIYSS